MEQNRDSASYAFNKFDDSKNLKVAKNRTFLNRFLYLNSPTKEWADRARANHEHLSKRDPLYEISR